MPRCECGGVIKPDVVLYEEPLDEDVVNAAVECIKNADTMIIAGTSLTVYPAASFVRLFCGDNLILINKAATPMDNTANIVIHGKVGEILGEI